MSAGYIDTFSWGLPGLSWIGVILLLIAASKLLTLCVWPSVRNFPFVSSIPFMGIAVGWGSFYWTTQYLARTGISTSTMESFATILSAGAAVTALAAVATIRLLMTPRGHAVFAGMMVGTTNRGAGPLLFIAALLLLGGAAFLIGSFYLLSGVVPAFAANPLAAKFFADEYTARAAPYMALFRLGMVLYQVGALIGILLLPGRVSIAKLFLFALLGAAALLALLSLRRGAAAAPILEGLMILLVVRGRLGWVIVGISAYLAVFAFGSAINQILLYALGLRDELGLDAIIKGLSDVSDMWWFMESYHHAGPPPSMGMTVFGGLVPYDFPWNPGNYTKMIVGADLNTASGGFRLPAAVWGYDAFGYPGLVLWSAFDGAAVMVQALLFRLVAEKGAAATSWPSTSSPTRSSSPSATTCCSGRSTSCWSSSCS